MDKQDETSTKEKIMRVAARMFSERGYDKVTTREIAKAIGITPASIYYHFSSKDDILKNLYRFYFEESRKECPDMNELLRMAETDPPHEVLMKSVFHYNGEMQATLDHILVTAAREICADPESVHFIRENIFDQIDNMLRPVLLLLVELKKIKPLDIDTFLRIVAYYCFSAAALNNSSFKQSAAEYEACMPCNSP